MCLFAATFLKDPEQFVEEMKVKDNVSIRLASIYLFLLTLMHLSIKRKLSPLFSNKKTNAARVKDQRNAVLRVLTVESKKFLQAQLRSEESGRVVDSSKDVRSAGDGEGEIKGDGSTAMVSDGKGDGEEEEGRESVTQAESSFFSSDSLTPMSTPGP